MDDLTVLLERAAARPRGEPRVIGTGGTRRHPVVALSAGLLTVVVAVAVVALSARHDGSSRPPAPPVTGGAVDRDGVAAVLPPGWYASASPTAPWLTSPHEVMSFATAPIEGSADDGRNRAACPSEIPEVGVDAARPRGAFVWIGDLAGGATHAPAAARPRSFAGADWHALCELPGVETRGTTFRESGRELVVTVVVGEDAPADVRRQVDDLLDSVEVRPR
jgi:hypothetical protein